MDVPLPQTITRRAAPPTPHPVISLPYSRLDFIMRCNGNHHGQSGRIYKTGGHKSTQRGFKGRLDEPEVEQMHRFRQDAYYQIFLRHHKKITKQPHARSRVFILTQVISLLNSHPGSKLCIKQWVKTALRCRVIESKTHTEILKRAESTNVNLTWVFKTKH